VRRYTGLALTTQREPCWLHAIPEPVCKLLFVLAAVFAPLAPTKACSLKLARIALFRRRCASGGSRAERSEARRPERAQRRRSSATRASLRLQAMEAQAARKQQPRRTKACRPAPELRGASKALF